MTRTTPKGEVERATEEAIRAAAHLTAADAGALQALRVLARKIDTDGALRDRGLDLPVDNVSIPTYLKFCDSLGLTPAGRSRLAEKKQEVAGGKLALLQGQAQRRKVG